MNTKQCKYRNNVVIAIAISLVFARRLLKVINWEIQGKVFESLKRFLKVLIYFLTKLKSASCVE